MEILADNMAQATFGQAFFFFQEQNQVLDHKTFRNKASISLSFAKMWWLSLISYHRGDLVAAAIVYMKQFFRNHN